MNWIGNPITTPKHQDNFVKLAEEGFYDSLLFHRVIQNFMIQGGDPDSKNAPAGQALGSGGPGYTVEAEFVDSLIHVKGALAAARTGDAVNPQKRSSGSQFYIVHGQPMNEDMLNRIEAQKGIRYSKEAGKEPYVRLEGGVDPRTERPYLNVIDRGPGVADDKLPKLFEPFFTTESSGTGLGLYISRELCEANQARLNYQPEPEGGSCFRISFAHPDRITA